MSSDDLIGIGLYAPAEAARLVGVAPGRIVRWLRGHDAGSRHYDRLWAPQVDLGEDGLFLGFRDLMEVRVASAFIEQGLSPQRVRRAIEIGRELIGDDHPLSTIRFRTDGRSVFMQVASEDGASKLIDLFSRQYAFQEVLERSLKNIDYGESGIPLKWWPLGRQSSVVVDPERSFGQPIEVETCVPVTVLAAAARTEGSENAASRAWDVPVRAVRRAVRFEREMLTRNAA